MDLFGQADAIVKHVLEVSSMFQIQLINLFLATFVCESISGNRGNINIFFDFFPMSVIYLIYYVL